MSPLPSGSKGDSEFQWIIDPLDGTTNFLHGFPQYAISIALRHNGQITQGVIYDPVANDLFTATRGVGPKTVNQLLSRWDMMSASVQDVRDVLFILLCSQQLTLVEQDKVATASRLNQVLADAGYVCNALATPYGVGVELPLADLMLAVGAPQGSVAERANWLRSESRRLGRMLRDQNRQRVADNAGDDAYVALVEDFDHRRAGLLLQWLPIGHI